MIDNGVPIENKTIFYLPAFGKEMVSFTWSGSGGLHRISVKVNPDRTIEESDYTNNEAYKDIKVKKKTDFTPPEISNVQAIDITTNSATITWDTDELSDSLVKYGETPGNYTLSKSNSSYVLKHSLTLTGLKENTTYYYVVNSTDKSGNSAESSEFSFTTFPTDTTPPASVEGLNETDKGTTWILWEWIYPFEPDFSHTMVYINGTFKANVSAPAHSYNATGLKPNTTYEIGTRTVDVAGNINMTWVNDTATTLEEDTEPPVITNISVTNITINSATIRWSTNEPSDSLVKYGTESGNYTMQEYNETYVIRHTIKLAGLEPNTTYYFVVNSTDLHGNSAESDEYNFTTLSLAPTAGFDTGPGTYPSISGTHNGTITTNVDITVSKLYTYPCPGTGGHTEYVRIWNATWEVTATWTGYKDDWHNISFDKPFVLLANKTYNYTIRTGSYPQIIHKSSFNATGGIITCDKFIGANGKIYYDWIPAIRLGVW